ncbi:hypothetical protein E4U54_008841 [Claviceps lovelessii]|nr:hypothetical protein E4U54_008841 [Claviceps lovelessii]
MHFSKSTALAVIAIFTGVTSADCSRDQPSAQGFGSYPCHQTAGTNIWHCGLGAGLTLIKDTDRFLVYSGTGGVEGFRVSCDTDKSANSRLYCSPESWGSIELKCPNNAYTVYGIQLIN